MSASKRSSTNPPKHYYELNKKQQQNWMKNTRKIEKNETAKRKFPPFFTTSNISLIHLHYLTTIEMLNELIIKAQKTRRYTIDTESEKYTSQGALIQIQMVHSITDSTILLIETNFLPEPETILFQKMKELCEIIFNGNNEIITWGSFADEFKNFNHVKLLDLGKVKIKTNLQFEFRNYHNKQQTHPETETRVITGQIYDTPGELNEINYETAVYDSDCKCGHHTHIDPNGKWSLQDAIAFQFKQFMDKSLTVNLWHCGLDSNLTTWKKKLFNRYSYDPQYEQNQRLELIEYAKNDCTSVTSLYFHMYPNGKNPERIINYETPITATTNDKIKLNEGISDISDDELPEIFFPRFNKTTSSLSSSFNQQKTSLINQQTSSSLTSIDNEPNVLITQATTEEINQLIPTEEQQRRSKSEHQRRKNLKLKFKQKTRPDFQLKIKRPIYYKYDYRKIRAQLKEDNIRTSNQITINQHKREVLIGFKSTNEQEKARTKMRINYFSKEQYIDRWG